MIAECEAAASRKATAAREVKAAEAAMHKKLAAEAEASAREAISVVVFGGFVVARVEVARRVASVALK